MLHFYINKADVAGYVSNLLKVFGSVLQSITITTPEKSEDCSVLIVTNSSSVADVKAWTLNGYIAQSVT